MSAIDLSVDIDLSHWESRVTRRSLARLACPTHPDPHSDARHRGALEAREENFATCVRNVNNICIAEQLTTLGEVFEQ